MSFDGWGPERADDGDASTRRGRTDREMARRHWWALNRSLRFYGLLFLIGTKTADALTTAVGLRYIPGIVELNPLANEFFAGNGLYAGLAIMSVTTVIVTVMIAEFLAVQIRNRLAKPRLALAVKTTIYALLSGWFGLVATFNALLIAEQVQVHLFDILAVV